MSEKYYVGKRASNLIESPALLPYSKVVIITGEDEDGVQITFEAGDDTGRVLEITNPWGTQQIANDLLARLRGYSYKPFDATETSISDDADLGDAVTVGATYSTIIKQDIVFDELGLSDVAAPNADETDNEFGEKATNISYAERLSNRRINRLTTRFTVERGRIETEIEDLDRGLSSRITQTAEALETEIQNTAAGLSTRISQNSASITAQAQSINSIGETVATTVSLNAQGILISNATGNKFTIDTENNISISFNNLTDAQQKQLELNNANNMAREANGTASTALNTANSADSKASAANTALSALKTNLGYTYIDSKWVISPNIVGGLIRSQGTNTYIQMQNGKLSFSYTGYNEDAVMNCIRSGNNYVFSLSSNIYKLAISSIAGVELGNKLFLKRDSTGLGDGAYGSHLPDTGYEGQIFFVIPE